jgi:hypothetical protein
MQSLSPGVPDAQHVPKSRAQMKRGYINLNKTDGLKNTDLRRIRKKHRRLKIKTNKRI